jgi:hypothetical protein
MHKAWPRLYRRMQNKKSDPKEDKELVIATRTWLCLYLFEHQYVIHISLSSGVHVQSLLGFLMGPDVQPC